MDEIVRIDGHDLSVKEYNGQRVVTFKDIDTVHNRPEGTARRNFTAHKDRFIEGEDYFIVTPQTLENTEMDEIRTSGIEAVNQRGTTLITEQGYLMLVKSFTDDLAWKVQRQLVDSYFQTRHRNLDNVSPLLKSISGLVDSMIAQEQEQKRQAVQIAKLDESTQAIKEAVTPPSDNWREDIIKSVHKIQKASNIDYKSLNVEMYSELERRAGCDLGKRLRNKQDRMRESGCTKTQINNLRKIDIINEDKKLREIYDKIVSEFMIRYCA